MADRLISADALTELIKDHKKNLVYNITHSKTRGITKSIDFIRGVEDGYYRILSDIKQMPTVEAEPTFEQIEEYCRKRCLVVVDGALFNEMKSRWSAEPKHGRCNTCRYMTKDELCTRYDDENGTHSTMPEGYCWLWERRMDEVEE